MNLVFKMCCLVGQWLIINSDCDFYFFSYIVFDYCWNFNVVIGYSDWEFGSSGDSIVFNCYYVGGFYCLSNIVDCYIFCYGDWVFFVFRQVDF